MCSLVKSKLTTRWYPSPSRVKHQQEKIQGHCILPGTRIPHCDEIVKIRSLRRYFTLYCMEGESVMDL